ncbi:PIG-L family deacetylase [Candidatus Woesearchaeota archaeon]|nr:PIG-L family deacetylase [Candidatus Woesearchaeota archaeon]
MKVLVVAAHPDDEILGVGGALIKHHCQGDDIYVCMVTKAYEPEWSKKYIKTKKDEASKVDRLLGIKKRYYCDFPTVKLNTIPHGEFNRKIAEIINETCPDVIYTHFKNDVNLDHRIIFNAVMVGARPGNRQIGIICFETPSSTEWSNVPFHPNHYVDIKEHLDKKVKAFSLYKSEVKAYPHPRSEKGIRIWANKRGVEVCREYAEAFIIIRSYW